jgi:hypothetical protein
MAGGVSKSSAIGVNRFPLNNSGTSAKYNAEWI